MTEQKDPISEEVALEREDERHAQRAQDTGAGRRDEEIAAEQVGVGTPPGQPPATGTGARAERTTEQMAGRRDDQRATWGASDAVPGSVPEGAPPVNVGGAEGDRPQDAVADFGPQDEAEQAGVYEPDERRSPGRSNLPPGR